MTKTVTWCSIRMKITWSAEHRSSVNTICTAPAQDYERSENPISYLYIRHHRYDIYRYHRNRQIIVIDELELRTVVLHSHGTSASYIGLKGLSLLLVQPFNATSLWFTLVMYDSFYSEISHSMAYGQTTSVRDLTEYKALQSF